MAIPQSLYWFLKERSLAAKPGKIGPPVFQIKILQYISLIFLSSALVWMVIVHMSIPVLPYEDAFITFRYVQNFLEGKGIVYNQGQKVFGSTTPLYFFWLSFLKFFFSEWSIPQLAVRFNFIHFGSAGVVLYFLLKKYSGNLPVALLGTLSFLMNPILLYVSGGGMESFLFVTMLLLVLLSMACKKPIWTGIFCGLSVLTRPEGLLILPLAIIRFRHRPGELAEILLFFSVMFLPWVIFAWLYFGTPIPLSLIAKTKPLYPLPMGNALGKINEWMTAWMVGFIPKRLKILTTITAWGLLSLSSLGALFAFRDTGRSVRPGILLFWLFILSYGIGNPLFFSWYWPNVYTFALITLVSGFYFWGLFWSVSSRRLGWMVWSIGGLWLIYATLMPNLKPILDKKTGIGATTMIIISDASRWRILAYEQAAKVLNRVTLPTDTVAASEVGALGFFYKGFIYDACGLISPEALPYLPVPPDQRLGSNIGAISTDFTKSVNPDWVVTMPYFSLKSLALSEWFNTHFELYEKIPLPFPLWGDSFVYIYKKRA